MSKPLFIAVEGIDGAGKTTIANMIRNYFTDLNIPNVRFSNPGTTPLGVKLRQILLNPDGDKNFEYLDTRVQWALFMAGTLDLAFREVAKSLNDGVNVIQDRWTLSTVVYQIAQQVDAWGTEELATAVQQLTLDLCPVQPDVCFFLNVTPEIAAQRLGFTGKGSDRFESGDIRVYRSRALAYESLISNSLVPYHVTEIRADDGVDFVWQRVKEKIDSIL